MKRFEDPEAIVRAMQSNLNGHLSSGNGSGTSPFISKLPGLDDLCGFGPPSGRMETGIGGLSGFQSRQWGGEPTVTIRAKDSHLDERPSDMFSRLSVAARVNHTPIALELNRCTVGMTRGPGFREGLDEVAMLTLEEQEALHRRVLLSEHAAPAESEITAKFMARVGRKGYEYLSSAATKDRGKDYLAGTIAGLEAHGHALAVRMRELDDR